MTKEDVWNLFKMTGNVKYYLKYKRAWRPSDGIIKRENSKRWSRERRKCPQSRPLFESSDGCKIIP